MSNTLRHDVINHVGLDSSQSDQVRQNCVEMCQLAPQVLGSHEVDDPCRRTRLRSVMVTLLIQVARYEVPAHNQNHNTIPDIELLPAFHLSTWNPYDKVIVSASVSRSPQRILGPGSSMMRRRSWPAVSRTSSSARAPSLQRPAVKAQRPAAAAGKTRHPNIPSPGLVGGG